MLCPCRPSNVKKTIGLCSIVLALIAAPPARIMAASRGGHETSAQRLATRLRLNLHHTPLKKALAAIAKAIGMTLLLNTEDMRGGNRAGLAPITLHLHHAVSARRAIDLILLKAAALKLPLRWNIVGGALLVGPSSWTDRTVCFRFYNVAPIVVVHGRYGNYVSLHRMRTLVYAIEGNVDRNSWISNGGRFGTCQFVGACLIIRALNRDQLRIARLLRGVERALAAARKSELKG